MPGKTSANADFFAAINRARRIVESIRENGQMKDTEFRAGFYQPNLRRAISEAEALDKLLDAITLARYEMVEQLVRPTPGSTENYPDDVPF